MRLLALLLLSLPAWGFAPVPPADMTCAQHPFANSRFEYIRCEFPAHVSKLVVSDSSYANKGAMLIPVAPTKKLKLRVFSAGYSAQPVLCDNWDAASADHIVIKYCPDHYPDMSYMDPRAFTWGGPYLGDLALGWRIAAQLEYVAKNYGHLVDWGAGIEWVGVSYSATTALLQTMTMPDAFTQALTSVVDVTLPHTLPVKNGISAAATAAWGDYDLSLMDFRVQAASGKLDHIYYRIRCATNDHLGVCDLDWFRLADQYKIAAYGTWDTCGHSTDCTDWPRETLQGESVVRRDKVFPVFTNSTANNWNASGHYNLGLSWGGRNVRDTSDGVTLPIRYAKRAASQPDAATFDVTIRPKHFKLPLGASVQWRIGEQSGSGVVFKSGEFTAENITLNSGENYQSLYIWNAE